MPHIPFLSRLHIREYTALIISIMLILVESFISIITIALPTPIIKLCYRLTRRLFNWLQSPQGRRTRREKRGVWSSIASASDFVELCELHGYYAEEHIVQTRDGYLLGLHRLGWKKGEEDVRVNAGEGSVTKKVVYLHHGLLMNSEVWVCTTEAERCLPFLLVERGYDVWLGNNRGNKYSKKSVKCAPTSTKFWDFSMDQFAFHDIPDSIDYILQTTRQPSLSYVGFSQGTAQAFASLSIHPTLNEKVNVFIALAPAMSPKGLTSSIVDTLVKASPELLFLAFGRRAILGSATMWQAILYPPIFIRLIDSSLLFLFGWTGRNIAPHQKLAAYPHLYSYTSTKSVVHWFQIMRGGTFQMYDDEAPSPFVSNRNKYYKIAKFPTRNIKTPIVLVYGGSDSLVDIRVMLKELPKHTVVREVKHYEHLDFLWADSTEELVFPHVFEALEKYTESSPTSPKQPASYAAVVKEPRTKRRRENRSPTSYRGLLPKTASPGKTTDIDDEEDEEDESSSTPQVLRTPLQKVSQNTEGRFSQSDDSIGAIKTPQSQSQPQHRTSPSRSRIPRPGSSSSKEKGSATSSTPTVTPKKVDERYEHEEEVVENSPATSLQASQLTNHTSTSRPEGWWSSDEVAGTGANSPDPVSPAPEAASLMSPSRESVDSVRSGRSGSVKSGRSGVFGERGISLGVGRAVGGLVSGLGVGTGAGAGASSGSGMEGSDREGKGKEGKRRRLRRRSSGVGGL